MKIENKEVGTRVRAILPIRLILIREIAPSMVEIVSSIFIFIISCVGRVIKYRYVSLHLKIWDFLTLVSLGSSIFVHN